MSLPTDRSSARVPFLVDDLVLGWPDVPTSSVSSLLVVSLDTLSVIIGSIPRVVLATDVTTWDQVRRCSGTV